MRIEDICTIFMDGDWILEIAPKIIGTYGLSYVLLTYNIFSIYYFQAMLKPLEATVISVGRGLALSGLFVIALPLIFGGNAIWYSMIVAEVVVAGYGIFNMINMT